MCPEFGGGGRVETHEESERERFLGSPTVRVDGRDVDPGAGERSDYGLKCRLYRSEEHSLSPVPPGEWIRSALEATHAAEYQVFQPGRTRPAS